MHNEQKPQLDREIAELWPGNSIELLKALHILTRDGKLNQDSRRKLKQVLHLVQLLRPHLDNINSVVDLGAGKSYLGFILYDLVFKHNPQATLWAVEQRKELVETCRSIANQSHFDRINFAAQSIAGAIQSADLPQTVDAVTALHACDTATDEAIAFALRKNAKLIALVPCCQAEVARLLDDTDSSLDDALDLKPLWRQGIHRREFGSHLTNVIRALFLESKGYKVSITELIGFEHSMKNELILAKKIQNSNPQAERKLQKLMAKFPLKMRLFAL